jgi:hypothetical protein
MAFLLGETTQRSREIMIRRKVSDKKDGLTSSREPKRSVQILEDYLVDAPASRGKKSSNGKSVSISIGGGQKDLYSQSKPRKKPGFSYQNTF